MMMIMMIIKIQLLECHLHIQLLYDLFFTKATHLKTKMKIDIVKNRTQHTPLPGGVAELYKCTKSQTWTVYLDI